MTEADKLVEDCADYDARFDGRGPLAGLSRADRERYLARSRGAVAIAVERCANVVVERGSNWISRAYKDATADAVEAIRKLSPNAKEG